MMLCLRIGSKGTEYLANGDHCEGKAKQGDKERCHEVSYKEEAAHGYKDERDAGDLHRERGMWIRVFVLTDLIVQES